MEEYTPPKEFIRRLRDGIKAAYPRSKGTWRHGSLLVKPFKTAHAEFLITFAQDLQGIIAEYHGFDWDAKGSNTAVVSFPKSKDKFDTVEGVISFLQYCVNKYIKEEQKFYDEGVAIHEEWEPRTKEGREEAKKLARIVSPKDFIKELGIKE